MQGIVVAGQTYHSDYLISIVFLGATATFDNGVLTLESLAGHDGDNGSNSAMQSIVVADQTYNSDALTSVVLPGATATLDNGVLTLTRVQWPPGDVVIGEDGED